MAPSRRVLAAAAVGVVAAAALVGATVVAGGSDDDGAGESASDDVRTVQPGAPGEDGRALTDEDVADLGTPGHTAADTEFMQGMLVHHGQALAMTALVDDRTDSEDVPLLAERITVSQEAEIAIVEQWLTDRGEEVPEAAAHAEHERMAGMATPEQLARLEAARGPAFDALFLELMIAHHQGALTMVDELYTAGGGVEPAADAFAREVEADQAIEIARMTDMQSARGS